jgi:hypothetical protein
MHTRTYRRALTLLVSTLGMLATATAIGAPAQAAPLCSVAYSASGWPASPGFPAGFEGRFTLTNNTTTTMKGWRVEVHFQAGVEVTTNWNSEKLLDVDPTYVFGNLAFNGEIRPGGAVRFGVTASKTANTISNTPLDSVCAPIY